MSSASDGAGGKPNSSTSKIKLNLQKNKQLSEWKVVTKKNKSSYSSISQPVSLNLQYINDKNPQLLPTGTHFQFIDPNAGFNNIISIAPANSHFVVMDLDNSPINMSDNTGHGHAISSDDHSPCNNNTLSFNTTSRRINSEQFNSNCRDPNFISFQTNV